MKTKAMIICMLVFTTFVCIGLNFCLKEENSADINMNKRSTANYMSVDKLKELDVEIIEETSKEEKVYDDLTLNELSEKINRSLNSTISDKGYLIVSHSLEMGVDPYMATAIILQETGCKWDCSYLVKTCNNVGGQKGSGCGSYSYFPSIDEGIVAFIDNLYYNYVSYGLTTPETINPKYAEDPNWSVNVNRYIESIKAL